MGFRVVPNPNGITGGASYTKVETDAKYVAKAGDTMTGSLAFATASIGIERKSPDGSTWEEHVNDNGDLINTK